MMRKISSFGVSLDSLVGLHRTVQFQLLSIIFWGTDLDYCGIEWFALEMNRDHSVIVENVPMYCIWTLLLTMVATPFLLRDFAHSNRYNGLSFQLI